MAKILGSSLQLLQRIGAPRKASRKPQRLWTCEISKRLSNQATEYQPTFYKPLDHSKSEIRIILLEPGNQSDMVSCRLETYSLNYRPRYDTLSYTWGDPKPTRPISVNGETVYIAENLFIALKSIRHRRKIVSIWADALCINQSDNREKSFQVAMMDRIYSQCKQTWISLGSPKELWANGKWSPGQKLEERMRLLKYLIRGTWRLLWHHLLLRRSRLSRLSVNHVSDTVRLVKLLGHKKPLSDEDIKNQKLAGSMLSWLITHPYWTRVWIAQEVCLSRLDPICMFGKWRIPLLHLDTILGDWRGRWEGMDGTFNIASTSPYDLANAADRTLEICILRDEFRRTRVFEPRWLGLTRCLQLASHRHASVAHDHIYGLRSLLSPETRKSVHLDYNVSVRNLYAAVTRSVLREEKSLDVLCAAVGTAMKSRNNLPSWVLDFSTPLLLPADRERDGNLELIGPRADETETLSLLGTSLIDDVVAVQEHSLEQWFNTRRLQTGMDITEGAQYAEKQLYRCMDVTLMAGVDPAPAAFLHIMTAAVYTPEGDKLFRQQQEEDFNTKLSELLREVPAAEDSQRLNKKLSRCTFGILSSFAKHHVGLPGRNDTFFCTRTGRIGKSSGDVQIGDELWELSPSRKPFLLRLNISAVSTSNVMPFRPDQYRLVGPCICSDPHREVLDGEKREARQIDLV